ncbi:MAG: CpsD/CapB family tyrosine-protein kinase [Alphaproteobacteria bacterium]
MMSIPFDHEDRVLPDNDYADPVSDRTGRRVWRRPVHGSPVRPWDPSVYDRNRIICHSDYTPEVDLFRMLAAQIAIWLEERQGHSFVVTSCGAGEGKTLISINLAICLAKNSSYETVLVDADLRRPNVANMLGIEPEIGLEQVLMGEASLEDCLLRSEIDGLFILPARSALKPSSSLLSTARLTRLAGQIERGHRDRLVVFDLPPVLLGDSCAPFLKAAAGCLMVAEEGRTTKAHLRRALSLIRDDKLIGITLNKASQRLVEQYGYVTYDYDTGKE